MVTVSLKNDIPGSGTPGKALSKMLNNPANC